MNVRLAYPHLLVLCVLLLHQCAKADHLPQELLAEGKPEIILAGLNLKTSTLGDAIRIYGVPTSKQEGSHWAEYVWEFPYTRLIVNASGKALDSNLSHIYVEGTGTGKLGHTGRGLKLGDDLNIVKRIYGTRYFLTRRNDWPVSVELMTVLLQWKSEDFTLTLKFDDQGKISSMWLILPECDPDGCGN